MRHVWLSHLYERWGFELQEDFALEADEKFSDRQDKGRVRFMVRSRAQKEWTAYKAQTPRLDRSSHKGR
jgi:hypothetical protein